jgi:hypothetical protein
MKKVYGCYCPYIKDARGHEILTCTFAELFSFHVGLLSRLRTDRNNRWAHRRSAVSFRSSVTKAESVEPGSCCFNLNIPHAGSADTSRNYIHQHLPHSFSPQRFSRAADA